MGRLFVSYSRRDAREVDRLVRKLESRGHDVWIDRDDLRGGDQWREHIVRAVERSHAFLLAVSPRSVESDNVRKELDVAEGAKARIIPLILKQTDVSDKMKYQLAGIQMIDMSTDPGTGFQKLIEVIGGDQRAIPPWYRRRKAQLLFWVLGGALFGLLISIARSSGASGIDYSLAGLQEHLAASIWFAVIGAVAGAMLRFLSWVFRLLGWVARLAGWIFTAVAGAWAGALLAGAGNVGPGYGAVGGAILLMALRFTFRRWRATRKLVVATT